MEATREKDNTKAHARRRNAVATRKAQTRLAQVEKEMQGLPRHCFGGRRLLRQGRLSEWHRRRSANALLAGEAGKAYGNEVAQWNPYTRCLQLKMPGGLGPVTLRDVRFPLRVQDGIRRCQEARVPVSWRVKLLPRGKAQLCCTYEEREPPVYTSARYGVLAVDLNADHIALTRVSKEGRVLDARRIDLEDGSDSVQQAARTISTMAASHCISVVAENLDFRKKKAWLKQYGKWLAAVLSLFRSRQVLLAVERHCRRRGVEVITVDPAWTTKLAKENRYPDRYRIGVHHAAPPDDVRRGMMDSDSVYFRVHGTKNGRRRRCARALRRPSQRQDRIQRGTAVPDRVRGPAVPRVLAVGTRASRGRR